MDVSFGVCNSVSYAEGAQSKEESGKCGPSERPEASGSHTAVPSLL